MTTFEHTHTHISLSEGSTICERFNLGDWWQSDVQVGDQRKPATMDVRENEVVSWPLCNAELASIQRLQWSCISISLHVKKKKRKKGVKCPHPGRHKVNGYFGAHGLSQWNGIKQKVLFFFSWKCSLEWFRISIRASLSQPACAGENRSVINTSLCSDESSSSTVFHCRRGRLLSD